MTLTAALPIAVALAAAVPGGAEARTTPTQPPARVEPWAAHTRPDTSPFARTGVPRPGAGGVDDRLWVQCLWSVGVSYVAVDFSLSLLPDVPLGRALDQAGGRDLADAATITVEGPGRQVFRPARLTVGRPEPGALATTTDFYEVVVRFDMDHGPRRPGELGAGDAAFLRALAEASTIRFDLDLEGGQRLTSTFPGRGAGDALKASGCPMK